MTELKVGIIGCGNISSIYFQAGQKFEAINIVACADLDLERAKARAKEYHIPKAYSVQELLNDPEIDLVLNLTIPKAHAEIACAALESGKHVYGEKPLAISLEDGKKILDVAGTKGLLVGNAPDTFLGGGLQTCRKIIDEGWIGTPVAATAFMMGPGHERWHPDPEFYYQTGGGPMFDMGPYYLTALISLLGPVSRVTGSTRITYPERTITSEPKKGQKIKVEVPTHVAGLLDFDSGVVGTLVTSFDVWHHNMPWIEIYGSEGTLRVPDPNTFGGPVLLRRHDAADWSELPLSHGFTENSRGIGLVDMAYALHNKREHRANGEMAYHVLEIMHGFHEAAEKGSHYSVKSTCKRPQAFPGGLNSNNISTLLNK
ncbi:Gfo/Idh/MocA family oxidoreductase [Pullulanibacillus sp. KACC 23026]|uniref:Gfo/Idh/MocA family protein n=1 Tax=Pullulanibacillus sp. KACC 23026 TaxID=3028315 RepID=UPI0023B07E30|nr:Gfo/Idh/MocA family oxidoreductase [Pullulanibacillus sp. KACC 23026]WEG13888.1 Gfo/Idh/MocA family oxidoreductase [Pullulanibacillus sp. KACC 23026]